MYLQRIEITGFKSFAQKTVLEFPRPGQGCPLVLNDSEAKPGSQLAQNLCGVAVVVGPNGSGKSNVADAIRWAMGEQSLKLLRGKANDDVIFSGSDKKAQLGMAEASLIINNEDRSMPIDYPEVIITRRIYRNGEAEYLLNKNRVRLADISMLIAKANFGQKSYSVIGQGMVDAILNTSSTERKDFFDEAVGVKQYQIKREQSIHKLESTWKNLKQAEAILEEIRPRLKSLVRLVNRLERRQEIEQELVKIQRDYYGSGWVDLVEQEKKLRPKFNQYSASVTEKNQELKGLQTGLDKLEKEDSRTEEFNRLQQKFQKAVEQKNGLIERRIILENKIRLAEQREVVRPIPMPIESIVKELRVINEGERRLFLDFNTAKGSGQIEKLQKDFEQLVQQIDRLIEKLEHPVAESRRKAEVDPRFYSELKEIATTAKEQEKLLAEISKEIAQFNQSQDQQKGKFFELQRQFQQQQNQYHEAANKLSEVRIELAKIETKRDDLKNEVSEEMKDASWLDGFSPAGSIDAPNLLGEIHRLKHQLELIGGIDQETVNEYQETKKRFDFLESQSLDLRQSLVGLKTVIADLDDVIHQQFNESFNKINKAFQKYFKVLFNGGRSELMLIKEDEPEEKPKASEEGEKENVAEQVSEESPEDREIRKILRGRSEKVIKGIEIVATPPGKKLRNISMLSGGERALASIALICAIISNNPPPFVVLDEVDAALDESNSERFSSIVDELSHQTQFIVITHNRATMHKANILYGVTMGEDGVSRLLSLKLEEAEKLTNRL